MDDSDGSKVERLNALPYDMKDKGIERKKVNGKMIFKN